MAESPSDEPVSNSLSRSDSMCEDRKEDSSRQSRNGRVSPTHSTQGSMRTTLRKLIQEKKAKKNKILQKW